MVSVKGIKEGTTEAAVGKQTTPNSTVKLGVYSVLAERTVETKQEGFAASYRFLDLSSSTYR